MKYRCRYLVHVVFLFRIRSEGVSFFERLMKCTRTSLVGFNCVNARVANFN